ncbi:MAG: OmpH family outer membrane protein [Deltaproteobacteria bacterium]|jgi:Skp family chaperone for outer membrane proteins|nr:OmpH family outer membrane protein [Deltaproteobacteria bacterium]
MLHPPLVPPATLAAAAIVAALLAGAAPAPAQGDAAAARAAQKVTVGVIDTGKAIDASRQGKAVAARIRTRYQELEKRLSQLQKAAQAKAEALNRETGGLTEAQFEDRRRELQREVEALQSETARAEEEMKSALESSYGPLYDRAAALASEHAVRKGLLLVLENSDEDKAVIFADPQVSFTEITEDVTRLLDSGGGGGSRAPAQRKPAAGKKRSGRR